MRNDKSWQAQVRGAYTVGEIAALGAAAGETHIVISCNRCECHGRLSPGRLLAEYGAGLPGTLLLQEFSADCPKRVSTKVYDICGIHHPQMPLWVGVAVPDDPEVRE
jgi:hypothetical protein